jgi:hypothetical protein
MVVAGGPRDVVRTPALGEAMTGSGTVPRLSGRAGMQVRAPDAPARVAIAPRAVRTTEEQVPVVGRARIRPTTRAAVTGTAPAPLIAVPVPPTALGLPAAVTGPSVVPAARAMETAIAGGPPGRSAAAPGRTGSSPGRGRPGPGGRCRPDGAASHAMAPGTWRRARRHRRSGLKPAGKSPGLGPSGRRWPRIFVPSAHRGPGSRPERALSAPGTLCSGRGTGLVRPSSRQPPPDRRGSVPHAGPGGAVPGPPRPVGRSGPPARR